MSWPLRLIACPTPNLSAAQVGDIWLNPSWLENAFRKKLSPKYWRDWHVTRAPLVVMLPGQFPFCVDMLAWNEQGHHGDGWTVTGEAPLITVSPSINIGGLYHGYITNGVITDDCEGRVF